LETVLGGSHYYRSFVGLIVVEDALLQLKAEAFWMQQGSIGDFEDEIKALQSDLDTTRCASILRGPLLYADFSQKIGAPNYFYLFLYV